MVNHDGQFIQNLSTTLIGLKQTMFHHMEMKSQRDSMQLLSSLRELLYHALLSVYVYIFMEENECLTAKYT